MQSDSGLPEHYLDEPVAVRLDRWKAQLELCRAWPGLAEVCQQEIDKLEYGADRGLAALLEGAES